MIFTDKGRVYGLKAWETPAASRQAKGSHIRNLLDGIRDDENVVSILPISKELIEEVTEKSLNVKLEEGEKKPPLAISYYSQLNVDLSKKLIYANM